MVVLVLVLDAEDVEDGEMSRLCDRDVLRDEAVGVICGVLGCLL